MANKKNAKAAEQSPVVSVAAPTISAAELATLGAVIQAEAATEEGFLPVYLSTVPGLVANNMIITNPNVINDAGCVATRSTQNGVTYWEANKGVDQTARVVQNAEVVTSKRPPRNVTMNFDIVDDFVPPATAKRRGGNRDAYPFDKLQVGQSFFVPSTEAKPEPWKAMQSTVSQAMGRYATVVAGQTKTTKKGNVVPVKHRTRQFSLYQAERGGVKGAMIFRQPDAAAGTAADDTE